MGRLTRSSESPIPRPTTRIDASSARKKGRDESQLMDPVQAGLLIHRLHKCRYRSLFWYICLQKYYSVLYILPNSSSYPPRQRWRWALFFRGSERRQQSFASCLQASIFFQVSDWFYSYQWFIYLHPRVSKPVVPLSNIPLYWSGNCSMCNYLTNLILLIMPSRSIYGTQKLDRKF